MRYYVLLFIYINNLNRYFSPNVSDKQCLRGVEDDNKSGTILPGDAKKFLYSKDTPDY